MMGGRSLLLVAVICVSLSACAAPLPENTIPLDRNMSAQSSVGMFIKQAVSLRSGLQSGDEILVTVLGEEELSGKYQLGADGTILMPLIDFVSLESLSLEDAAVMLVERYQDGYLIAPEITIEIVTKGA